MKAKDHEMNFNTLTQSMAAANSGFFPNIKHMPKNSPTNLFMVLWTLLFCFEMPHNLAEDRNLVKQAQ